MHCRSPLAVAGLAVCIAWFGGESALAGPRTPARAPARQPAPKLAEDIHLNTLAAYTTQDLRLPLDHERRPFEAAITFGDEVKVLELHPYSLRGADFMVLVQDATGQLVPYDMPAPTTYRGHIRGEAGSMVAASLIDGQLWATVAMADGRTWMVQPLDELAPGAPAPRTTHAVYRTEDVLPVDHPVKCGVETTNQQNAAGAQGAEGGIAGSGFEVLEIGCDADFEYFQLNGSSVNNTVNDIENLLNAVEFIYERDVDLTFEITVVVVRSDVNDPYTASGASSLLNQFANTWNSSPESGIRRDVAHLFTGREVTGDTIGIAVTPSTCFTSSAYSMVQSKYTSNFSLRQSLSAHELGHTLSAEHCDGNGDCHIMCSGNGGCNGIFGSNLRFGVLAVSQITGYANSSAGNCMAALPGPLTPPFFDDFEAGVSLDSTKWVWVDGGTVTTAALNEPSPTRSLNLDATGSNLFDDDQVRTNFISLVGQGQLVLAYYTQHIGVEEGETLTVEYWANNLRWTQINQVVSDGIDQSQFEYHQHPLPPNAFWSEFRVRFRVDVNSGADDWYIDNVYVGPDPGLELGACCLPDFSCAAGVTEEQCVTVSGGTWQGVDSTCDGLDCTPPLGACCFADQTCAANTTQFGCEVTAGGTWQGDGVPCSPGQCSPPSGACCARNGACIGSVLESLCDALGGIYQGDGVNCADVSCPQPTGACCDPNGQCIAAVTEDACVNAFGGTYQGDNVDCGSVSCPGGETCPADMVSNVTFQPPPDGVVDGADLAFMLGAWGPNPGSPADIVSNVTFQPPPDGVVDGADLAYMLGSWGTCE